MEHRSSASISRVSERIEERLSDISELGVVSSDLGAFFSGKTCGEGGWPELPG